MRKTERGQAVVEFAVCLPLIVLLLLGVVEVSYALLDQHVITKLSREGSNLISRDASLQDAAVAMTKMSTRPVDFSTSSRVIFSVIRQVETAGASNFGKPILYQRYAYGGLAGTSVLATRGGGSFGGPPDYQASNADNDTNLQITNLPAGLLVNGGMLYVTEIYTRHQLLTPFDRFGVTIPSTLYSIAYF